MITGAGTTTETWTLDSDLPYLTAQTVLLAISPFKKVGEKTIAGPEILDNRLYVPIKNNMIGRKFLMKLVFEVFCMRPHIDDISFIYDELGYE